MYLDSAATTQKPESVLAAMDAFYTTANGNAHRGMHPLAERATVVLEECRTRVQKFVNAKHTEEIIFTKSCTEAINLVARSMSALWKKGDAIVVTALEHHSNIVPWQQTGMEVRWVPCDSEGTLNVDVFEKHLADGKVKLVAVTAQSNVLGVRPPLKKMIEIAHKAGALVLVDAAQAIAHMPIDVQELDCDFLAFSGHKLYGPLGIGVLYGKKNLLKEMPPFLGGGMMIHEVREDGFTAADLPQKFEAGTQPIAEAAGLHAAIDWLTQFSWEDIEAHESALIQYAYEKLAEVPGIHILGPILNSQFSILNFGSCISFTIEGVHPHDLTDLLGQDGICLRAGHHCTQPLHRHLQIAASTRLSIGIYTTNDEIDKAVADIKKHILTLS